VLLASALVLLRISVPAHPAVPGSWLTDSRRRAAVAIALNLVPFAGIAFLWFIGVVRDRVGEREDRFFATSARAAGPGRPGMNAAEAQPLKLSRRVAWPWRP
jgi:hypothetical protein